MESDSVEKLIVVDPAEAGDDREPRRYEISYLLAPIIAVEAVASTVETLIRGTILAAGGQILSGEEPKLLPLAYPIRKTIDNKSLRFREAHFASLRFNFSPDQIAVFDQTLRLSSHLLRFLIVELPVQTEELRRRPKAATPPFAERVKAESFPAGETMSQAEMDREIEGLLTHVSQ